MSEFSNEIIYLSPCLLKNLQLHCPFRKNVMNPRHKIILFLVNFNTILCVRLIYEVDSSLQFSRLKFCMHSSSLMLAISPVIVMLRDLSP
jgi:hypothetical protein